LQSRPETSSSNISAPQPAHEHVKGGGENFHRLLVESRVIHHKEKYP
jgi:hypothetical protein